MDLQNAKVYSDGHHFIAMPNDAFPRPRTKARHKTVQPNFLCNKDELPHSNSPPNAVNENLPPTPKQEISLATPKEKFEVAYKESLSLPKRERKAHIKEQLKDTFKDKEELNLFVDNNVERMKRNAIKRKVRLNRKLNLQQCSQSWSYFVTFTYSDEKQKTLFARNLLQL